MKTGPVDLKRFAACLKRAINTKASYAALDKGPGGTWTAGGCWTLAHAVAGLVDGELYALVTPGEPELDDDGNDIGFAQIVQHVVVKVGGRYLDGDGLSAPKELVRRWNTVESLDQLGGASLVPFTEELQIEARRGIPCDTRVATAILPALMKCARRR